MLKTYLGMLFGRKHILKTIFILFVVALFIKLGFWQLDRLQWRRNLNAQLATQLAQPPTQINDLATPDNLLSMSDQKIAALGHFDYSEQLILKNQGGDVGP
ncbi:MAG TPA: SURF1 family protein, partial [Anaerolineae bacterium]|nr:SURF1 family protein [Anaerolineae bacterium]